MKDRRDPMLILKEKQGHNNLSLETMKQELELSVESRSFVNRVNDQVRKRQKRILNVTEDGEKHSMIWGLFMTVTMESAVFTGKNYLNNCQSIANTKISHSDKCSTHLQDWYLSKMRSLDWKQLVGENHSWKYLSLIGDERVINLQRTKVLRLFRLCIVSW